MTVVGLQMESNHIKEDIYSLEEEEAIQELYELIDADDDVKMLRKFADKSLIVMGLRACNLDVKAAFKSLHSLHLHATKTYPELFASVDPKKLRHVIDKQLFQVVKRPDENGPCLIVFRIKNWKPSEVTVEEVAVTGALYVYAAIQLSPEIPKKGIVIILDIFGFKFAHARQASPDLVLKAVRIIACIPPVLKGIIIINSLPLFEYSFNLIKWVLPQDLRNMVHFAKSDMSQLSNVVAANRLPKELGGSIPDKEAYVQGIEEEIYKNPQLFNLIKHLQSDILTASNPIRIKKR